ncbi:MAG: copper chaperone Copz family protein [Chloroflexi bacterium]|nr:copper chaperone Copz family protein [Chloroflexota bacterium]
MMSEDCCAIPTARAPLPTCPECGQRTRAVAVATVRHHVRPDLVATLGEGQYGFCDNPRCSVVYALAGGPPLRTSDLRTRVGLKQTEDPVPVCYCWSFTERQIVEDVLAHGRSTVREYITQRVADGACGCELNNPAGRCCLGNVGAAIKKGERELLRRGDAESFDKLRMSERRGEEALGQSETRLVGKDV